MFQCSLMSGEIASEVNHALKLLKNYFIAVDIVVGAYASDSVIILR